MSVEVEVSWGELLDKVTILQIKSERMTNEHQRTNVQRELKKLENARAIALKQDSGIAPLEKELKSLNEALWDIEDAIRNCERIKDFGPQFVELARSVYTTNDQRAAKKRQINETLGSSLVEEKSYQEY